MDKAVAAALDNGNDYQLVRRMRIDFCELWQFLRVGGKNLPGVDRSPESVNFVDSNFDSETNNWLIDSDTVALDETQSKQV